MLIRAVVVVGRDGGANNRLIMRPLRTMGNAKHSPNLRSHACSEVLPGWTDGLGVLQSEERLNNVLDSVVAPMRLGKRSHNMHICKPLLYILLLEIKILF